MTFLNIFPNGSDSRLSTHVHIFSFGLYFWSEGERSQSCHLNVWHVSYYKCRRETFSLARNIWRDIFHTFPLGELILTKHYYSKYELNLIMVQFYVTFLQSKISVAKLVNQIVWPHVLEPFFNEGMSFKHFFMHIITKIYIAINWLWLDFCKIFYFEIITN